LHSAVYFPDRQTRWGGGDAENAGAEFAALNGYGKPLPNLKSTQRRNTMQ